MATQNPIETEGTYPLPEAQVDRFMMKVVVDYPNEEEEFVIVERVTGAGDCSGRRLPPPSSCRAAAGVPPDLRRSGAHAIRGQAGVGHPAASSTACASWQRYITFGASPRATICMIEGARALAFLRGRTYVLPEDVIDLVPDVLRHRLVLSYEALSDGQTADADRHAGAAGGAAARQAAGSACSGGCGLRKAAATSPDAPAANAGDPVAPSACCAASSGRCCAGSTACCRATTARCSAASASTSPTCANTSFERRRALHRLERHRAPAVAARARVPGRPRGRRVVLLDLSGSVDFGSQQVRKRALASELVAVLARLFTRYGNRVGAVLHSEDANEVIPGAQRTAPRAAHPRPHAEAG
jgi:hypothetical protein